jgi:hypothetical protein
LVAQGVNLVGRDDPGRVSGNGEEPHDLDQVGRHPAARHPGRGLIMQTDGNAVLYKGRTALWASVTNRKASTLVMQRDGNLVVISGRTPIWSTNTHGSTGAYLAVQNDSNLVIYNIRNKPVWNRYMVIGTLGAGRVLKPHQMLYSFNRIYRLQMQTDGNAVIVYGRTPVWSTNTAGR